MYECVSIQQRKLSDSDRPTPRLLSHKCSKMYSPTISLSKEKEQMRCLMKAHTRQDTFQLFIQHRAINRPSMTDLKDHTLDSIATPVARPRLHRRRPRPRSRWRRSRSTLLDRTLLRWTSRRTLAWQTRRDDRLPIA